jgi:hypothetical protein
VSSSDPEMPAPRRHPIDHADRRFSSEPPATSRRRLTRLLSRWADARRLDPGAAESIRLAARAAPVDLGFDWWWRLLDPENGTAFRAAAARSTCAGSPPPTVEPPFAAGIAGLTTWSQDDAEYQPYLRLA